MSTVTHLLDSLHFPRDEGSGALALHVVDQGPTCGIDIRIYNPLTSHLRFEIIALNPETCPLTANRYHMDAAFHAFCRTLDENMGDGGVCIVVQFFTAACSGRSRLRNRNCRLQRLVETIADEILTHRPGLQVTIAMLDTNGTLTSLM